MEEGALVHNYSNFQQDAMDGKSQLCQSALLHYILDAQAALRIRSEVDLQQVAALIEALPCAHHTALYLQQRQHFYRLRHAVSQEENGYLRQYPVPDNIFVQLQSYQHHSGQAYIFLISAYQDRLLALFASLDFGN